MSLLEPSAQRARQKNITMYFFLNGISDQFWEFSDVFCSWAINHHAEPNMPCPLVFFGRLIVFWVQLKLTICHNEVMKLFIYQ
jgi:hypothetical protein